MAHRPVAVDLKVIEHVPSLPYRWALEAFVSHVHDCEPCAEVFAQDESACSEYCPTGHSLFHIVERKIAAQNSLSVWN